MKNLVMSTLILFSAISFAQPDQRSRKMPSPEIQAKKMTLALDLTEEQEKEILNLFETQKATMKKNRPSKEERHEMTDEQKEQRMVAMLDQKITMKREMQKILNENQYQRWEKMVAKRARAKRMKQMKRRRR